MEWNRTKNTVYSKIMQMIPLSKSEESNDANKDNISSQVANLGEFFPHIDDVEKILHEIEESKDDALAKYKPMHSKGEIIFFWKRMGVFFWYIIRKLDRNGIIVTQKNLEYLCEIFIVAENRHERFHHECDVIRHLLGTNYVRNTEEALAVACSYLSLTRNRNDKRTQESKVDTMVFNEFLSIRFAYKKAGYCDWVNYRSEEDFAEGLTQYIAPQIPLQFLIGSDVNMKNILHVMQNNIGCSGYDYIVNDDS